MRNRSIRGWLAALGVLLGTAPAAASAAELPAGFSDRVAFSGIQQPTSLAFAPDGRVFVAEKRGTLLSYGSMGDTSPITVADLRSQVNSFYERGLLSLAVDPRFPAKPYVYVAYTHDALIGGTAPLWGDVGRDRDDCFPGDPDPTFELGCKVSSRVSRLKLGSDGAATSERVLVEDWCQQFPSHSIGDLGFDSRGALLVGGGDGASFGATDVGRLGDSSQVCEDPEGEGGALRAQDLVTDNDPAGLSGTVIRIDPATGAPLPDNPARSSGGNTARIVAYGLRNPFRFAVRPGTDELFIGDVGWSTTEEIDVVDVGETKAQRNFGWPCFEGDLIQPSYLAENPSICAALYVERDPFNEPWFSYGHFDSVVAGDRCPDGDGVSAISGLAFDSAATGFPEPLDDAFFFADYTRNCIWSMRAGRFGKPQASTIGVFESGARSPIDLVSGPGGLYYPDLFGGAIHRISYDRPTVELKLRSRPKGVALRLGERLEQAPVAFTLGKGTRHRVSAPLRTRVRGRGLTFERWSDAGEAIHEVRAAAGDSLTAIYSCARGCNAQK